MIKEKVNCIVPVYNVARYLPDALNSIFNQTIGFENINLVIVNDGSTDETDIVVGVFRRMYPDIVYLQQKNQGVSAARNAGLDFCQENFSASYTCFLDGDDKYSQNQMEVLINFFHKHTQKDEMSDELCPDVAFLPIKLFERENTVHYQYRITDRGKTRVIDLNEETTWFSHVNNAMFKTEAIINERFDENLVISEDASFLLQVLLKTNLAGWHNEGVYYNLRKRMDESSAIDVANASPAFYERISLYRNEFEEYINTLGRVPRAVQSSRLYDIHWFKSRDIDPVKYGINIDTDKALEDIKYLIQNVDEDLLEQNYIPYWFQAFFKQMIHGDIHLRRAPNEIEARYFIGDEFFELLSGEIQIQFIKQVNHVLHVRGFFVKPSYQGIELVCKFNGQFTKATIKPSYQNDMKYFLGKKVFPTMDFEFNIDISNLENATKYTLEFYFSYQEGYEAAFMVHSWFSRFYNKNTFFIGDNAIIRKGWSSHGLEVEKLSKSSLNTFVLSRKGDYKDPYLFHRYVENFETYRNKRIWLFIDRPTSIGDNAEALFRYCCNINDGIEKFMVIPDGSYYKNFEGVNSKIIIFGSFEFKFLLMFAEKVISSTTFFEYIYVDTNIKKWEFKKISAALSNVQEVFLQHGVIHNYGIIEAYANNSMRDIDLMFTTMQKEYDMMLLPETGYNKDNIKLTGLPRFDLLTSSPEKIITFAPTWRKKYKTDSDIYNPDFIHTDLFRSINDLINNSRLLEAIQEYGFKIILKLHPQLQLQTDDFRQSSEVEIVGNEISYNEIFRKSSIMITDYSSSVFDFAYLKKPIIYYQKIELDYELSDDIFNYENDGFGVVTQDQSEVVSKVIEYMKNGCKMEKKYKKRVDQFFTYHDQSNSERAYQEILKMPKRERDALI